MTWWCLQTSLSCTGYKSFIGAILGFANELQTFGWWWGGRCCSWKFHFINFGRQRRIVRCWRWWIRACWAHTRWRLGCCWPSPPQAIPLSWIFLQSSSYYLSWSRTSTIILPSGFLPTFASLPGCYITTRYASSNSRFLWVKDPDLLWGMRFSWAISGRHPRETRWSFRTCLYSGSFFPVGWWALLWTAD